MSYTPTEWKKGDIVSSTKLNKMEQGIADAGGGPLLVTLTLSGSSSSPILTTDKTAGEIYEAFPNVQVVAVEPGEKNRKAAVMAVICGVKEGVYYLDLINLSPDMSSGTVRLSSYELTAESANDTMANKVKESTQ